ncbi:MAG: hypothetical protein DRJ97_01690 [Thermoprotei archaeon]|nr:MAG: hypothetical protein DRJ97_01690 [Thermoprotei archaeon]
MYPAQWARERLLTSRILRRLSEHIPGFKHHEPEGRMLANVAVNDFRNYVKYKPPSPNVDQGEYADCWAERWLDKWRERVKLVFRPQDGHVFAKHEKLIRDTSFLWSRFPHLNEALELVVDALIDVGEICFTNLLAESTLRGELLRYKQLCRSDEEALRRIQVDPLKVVKEAMYRAKSLRHVKGPLVWLRVDEHIWRSSTGKIVEEPPGNGEEEWEQAVFGIF